MHKAIFAFDFSCNKPAMTSYINGVIDFYVWPSDIDDKSYDRLTSCDVNILNRKLCHIKEKWKRPLKDTSLLLALNTRQNIALMSEC